MKLGLLTAAFPRRTLGEVAAWAGGAGFEALEIASWPCTRRTPRCDATGSTGTRSSFSAGAGSRRGCRGTDRSTGPGFVGASREVGYDHVISVEHEDDAFEGSDELVEHGVELARDTLRPLVGGT